MVKVISYPAAHMTNEGGVSERGGQGAGVEEVRHVWATEASGEVTGVREVRSQWAECVVTAYDGDGGGDERGLGEGDGEVDPPLVLGDVLAEEARAGVLFDAEEAEEGEEGSAPVTGISEVVEVDVLTDVVQILDGEATGGLTVVGVAVVVEEAGFDTVEGATTREVGEAGAHGVVSDGGHEAGEACDAVTVGVDDADAAQLELGDGGEGVDPYGGADGVEGALSWLVREVRVESERVAGEAVDELT
jgi:hypothetical protein